MQNMHNTNSDKKYSKRNLKSFFYSSVQNTYRKKNIRIFSILAGLVLTLTAFCPPLQASASYALPSGTSIHAASSIVVSIGASKDEDTVVFDKDADTMRSPAALVRLMVGATAIKIIREKNMDIGTATGTFTSDCKTAVDGTGLILANMAVGETWTVRDLLSVSMITTAADACVTLAVTLDGSQSQFVADMNKLAKEIGCKHTSFSNVTGIDDINQYTSARDLYLIMRYGMEYSEFEPLFSAASYICHPVKGGTTRSFVSTNSLLRSSSVNYYAPAKFGKSGWTDGAGRCVAAVAQDSGYEYLCVVLGCPATASDGSINTNFSDAKVLFRWAFNNFTYKTLLSKNEPITKLPVKLAWSKDSVTLVPEKDFAATVASDVDQTEIIRKVILTSKSVNAPVKKGAVYGKIELYINLNEKIGEVNLVANESLDRNDLLFVWSKIESFLSSPWFYVGVGLLAVLLIGYIVLSILHNQQRRRNRMKRVKKFH